MSLLWDDVREMLSLSLSAWQRMNPEGGSNTLYPLPGFALWRKFRYFLRHSEIWQKLFLDLTNSRPPAPCKGLILSSSLLIFRMAFSLYTLGFRRVPSIKRGIRLLLTWPVVMVPRKRAERSQQISLTTVLSLPKVLDCVCDTRCLSWWQTIRTPHYYI